MAHHAYVIEAEAEEGIAAAERFVARELGMKAKANPDLVVLRYGLLPVEEARRIAQVAQGAPVAGKDKVVVIAAARCYGESQNALLKLFEEPPPNTYLFLILPNLGALLPTLKSRVQILGAKRAENAEAAKFLAMSTEKRTALIKKLATGKDEEERREHRDEAIAIVNAVEQALRRQGLAANAALLGDISKLRPYLYDRAAPTRMILEHLSIMMDLV